jgi:hypothetical protein
MYSRHLTRQMLGLGARVILVSRAKASSLDEWEVFMPTFDGSTDNDRRLWNTYIALAKYHAIRTGGQPAKPQHSIAEDPTKRVEEPLAEALQTILFSCFALEYRLKRVLSEMNPQSKPKCGLESLVKGRFWDLLQNTDRCDGKGKCARPKEWATCEPKLTELTRLRNKIAHANYEDVLRFFGKPDPLMLARGYYNAVVDAVMLINIGTGYDTSPLDEIEEYFRSLRVVSK